VHRAGGNVERQADTPRSFSSAVSCAVVLATCEPTTIAPGCRSRTRVENASAATGCGGSFRQRSEQRGGAAEQQSAARGGGFQHVSAKIR